MLLRFNLTKGKTMKITKILVALSFLFAVSTAQAGEMTVTGSMQATYQSEPGFCYLSSAQAAPTFSP